MCTAFCYFATMFSVQGIFSLSNRKIVDLFTIVINVLFFLHRGDTNWTSPTLFPFHVNYSEISRDMSSKFINMTFIHDTSLLSTKIFQSGQPIRKITLSDGFGQYLSLSLSLKFSIIFKGLIKRRRHLVPSLSGLKRDFL